MRLHKYGPNSGRARYNDTQKLSLGAVAGTQSSKKIGTKSRVFSPLDDCFLHFPLTCHQAQFYARFAMEQVHWPSKWCKQKWKMLKNEGVRHATALCIFMKNSIRKSKTCSSTSVFLAKCLLQVRTSRRDQRREDKKTISKRPSDSLPLQQRQFL